MAFEPRAVPPALRPRWRGVAQRIRRQTRLTGLSAYRGFVEFYNRDDLTYAASIAYFSLLSLFPLCLLALSILGSVTADEADRAKIVRFILRYFPTQFAFLTERLDVFRRAPIRFGIVGAIALTWAALGVFGAISTAVNYAWGVEKQRSYLKHKLGSFLMLLAAWMLLLTALVLMSAIEVVQASWFAPVLADVPGLFVLRSFVVRWATTGMLILVVGLIFYFVPNAKVRFRDVWVGAVATGLLWKGALEAFSWYVRDMSRFTNVHGSIAAVVVFLIWIYTSAVILLYGVEFTATYARLLRHRPDEIPAAASPRT